MNVEIVVLKCQKCNECLNVHNSLGLLFEAVLKCLCFKNPYSPNPQYCPQIKIWFQNRRSKYKKTAVLVAPGQESED